MKRSFCLLMTAILALSLAACGSAPAQTASATPQATAAPATPPPTSTPTPAQPSATPAATPTPAPSPTPSPTPMPAPSPTAPSSMRLTEQIMQEKKWNAYPYADTVKKAVAIVLANSTAYTPEQLAARLRKTVDKIVIGKTISDWGYFSSSKTVSIIPESDSTEALVYLLTHCVSGFLEYQNHYPKCTINGSTWCFGSGKSARLGPMEVNSMLVWGLTDFISSRKMPNTAVAQTCCTFNGEIVTLTYFNDGDPRLPEEQGYSILFYYAAGSSEVEKAFFGDRKASDTYKKAFAKQFGAKKLGSLIAMVDDVSLHSYASNLSAKQQKDGLKKVKAYEEALLGLLETRQKGLKTQKEREQFISDLALFEDYNLQFREKDYQQKIADRIGTIRTKALDMKIA